MINSIETKNYHSHRHTKIEFCDGLNIITGASDAGKSDILRHAKWVIDNRPSGESVRSWGLDPEEVVSVVLTTPEGRVLKKRQQGKVIYELEVNNQTTTLEAVRLDVPTEVQEFFNFSEFNYQSQHSPYFLLGDTGGDIAKKLNDLVGLSIIDTIFKNLNGKAADNKRKSEEENSKALNLSEQIKEMLYLDDIEKELSNINLMISEYEEKSNKNERLEILIADYKDAKEKIDLCKKTLEMEKEVNILTKNIAEYKIKAASIIKLENLISSLKDTKREIDSCKKILEMEKYTKSLFNDIAEYRTKIATAVRLETLISDLKELNENIIAEKEWLKIEDNYVEIKEMLDKYLLSTSRYEKIKQIVSRCKLISSDLNVKDNELNDLLSQKKKLLIDNKICPLCKTKLTEDIVERIIQ